MTGPSLPLAPAVRWAMQEVEEDERRRLASALYRSAKWYDRAAGQGCGTRLITFWWGLSVQDLITADLGLTDQ
jgi:hypothetical protein